MVSFRRCFVTLLVVLTLVAGGLITSIRARAIIGGYVADEGILPAVPKLVIGTGTGGNTCSGVLVSQQWVLTAQHCTNKHQVQGHPWLPKDATVHFVTETGSQEKRKVSDIIRSPGYNSGSGVADVALLRLASPVTDISPLPVLAAGQLAGLSQVERFGWGVTKASSTSASKVLKYSVEGLYHVSAVSRLGVKVGKCSGDFSWPGDYALWGYDIGQGGAGEGDSGGPVVTGTGPGSFAVAGITEGFIDLANCSDAHPVPDKLRKQWLGLANRVDQGSAEWEFLRQNVPGLQVTAAPWAATHMTHPSDTGSLDPAASVAVSCPQAGHCVAVGGYGDDEDHPLIETLTGTTWTDAEPALPPDAYPYNQDASLGEVSCAAAQSCVAVGSYEDASTYVGLIERLSNGTWRAQRAPNPPTTSSDPYLTLADVDCPAATSCVAVGTYDTGAKGVQALIETFTAGKWTARPAPLPVTAPDSELISIACSAAGSCAATGTYADSHGDTQGFVEHERNGHWTASLLKLPRDAVTTGQSVSLEGVSCPSATDCVAVGSYDSTSGQAQPFLVTYHSGAWKLSLAPEPAGTRLVSFFFTYVPDGSGAITCPAAGSCLAIGAYVSADHRELPVVEHLTSNGWAALPVPLPSGANSSGLLLSLSCPSASECVVTGDWSPGEHAEYDQPPLVDTLHGSTWTRTPVLLPADAAGGGANPGVGSLSAINCTPSRFCAATGSYLYKVTTISPGLLVSGTLP